MSDGQFLGVPVEFELPKAGIVMRVIGPVCIALGILNAFLAGRMWADQDWFAVSLNAIAVAITMTGAFGQMHALRRYEQHAAVGAVMAGITKAMEHASDLHAWQQEMDE